MLLTSLMLLAAPQETALVLPVMPAPALDPAPARSHALAQVDAFLDWAFAAESFSYEVSKKTRALSYSIQDSDWKQMAEAIGYFSHQQPLIARVSTQPAALAAISSLLILAHKACGKDLLLRQIMIGEVLTKGIAYYQLEEGMILRIPEFWTVKDPQIVAYKISKCFDLWQQMPAFGLTPLTPCAPSLLLFRGTDLSLASRSSWASVLSDLDAEGPGHSVFEQSKPALAAWAAEQSGPIIALGFSLGGSLAIYSHALGNKISQCIAFSPPGLNQTDVHIDNLTVFVSQKDPVSKWGYLVGKVYELKASGVSGPIHAHNLICSAQPELVVETVDVAAENATRQGH